VRRGRLMSRGPLRMSADARWLRSSELAHSGPPPVRVDDEMEHAAQAPLRIVPRPRPELAQNLVLSASPEGARDVESPPASGDRV